MNYSPWFDSSSSPPFNDGVYEVDDKEGKKGYSFSSNGLFYGIWSSIGLAYTMKGFFFNKPELVSYLWRGIVRDE